MNRFKSIVRTINQNSNFPACTVNTSTLKKFLNSPLYLFLVSPTTKVSQVRVSFLSFLSPSFSLFPSCYIDCLSYNDQRCTISYCWHRVASSQCSTSSARYSHAFDLSEKSPSKFYRSRSPLLSRWSTRSFAGSDWLELDWGCWISRCPGYFARSQKEIYTRKLIRAYSRNNRLRRSYGSDVGCCQFFSSNCKC